MKMIRQIIRPSLRSILREYPSIRSTSTLFQSIQLNDSLTSSQSKCISTTSNVFWLNRKTLPIEKNIRFFSSILDQDQKQDLESKEEIASLQSIESSEPKEDLMAVLSEVTEARLKGQKMSIQELLEIFDDFCAAGVTRTNLTPSCQNVIYEKITEIFQEMEEKQELSSEVKKEVLDHCVKFIILARSLDFVWYRRKDLCLHLENNLMPSIKYIDNEEQLAVVTYACGRCFYHNRDRPINIGKAPEVEKLIMRFASKMDTEQLSLFLTGLGYMRYQWERFSISAKSILEQQLRITIPKSTPVQLSRFLRGFTLLDYDWLKRKSIVDVINNVFLTVFHPDRVKKEVLERPSVVFRSIFYPFSSIHGKRVPNMLQAFYDAILILPKGYTNLPLILTRLNRNRVTWNQIPGATATAIRASIIESLRRLVELETNKLQSTRLESVTSSQLEEKTNSSAATLKENQSNQISNDFNNNSAAVDMIMVMNNNATNNLDDKDTNHHHDDGNDDTQTKQSLAEEEHFDIISTLLQRLVKLQLKYMLLENTEFLPLISQLIELNYLSQRTGRFLEVYCRLVEMEFPFHKLPLSAQMKLHQNFLDSFPFPNISLFFQLVYNYSWKATLPTPTPTPIMATNTEVNANPTNDTDPNATTTDTNSTNSDTNNNTISNQESSTPLPPAVNEEVKEVKAEEELKMKEYELKKQLQEKIYTELISILNSNEIRGDEIAKYLPDLFEHLMKMNVTINDIPIELKLALAKGLESSARYLPESESNRIATAMIAMGFQ